MIEFDDLPKFYQDRLRKLQALEDYGVDNWEGYGDATRSLNSEEDEGEVSNQGG